MLNPSPQKLQFDLFADRYTVTERVSAKAHRIRLEVVSPDEVVLTIPRHGSKTQAREFLREREAWVQQKRAELRQRFGNSPVDPQRMKWDGRDTLPLRGVPVRIELTPTSLKKITLRDDDDRVSVFCPSAKLGDREALETALRQHWQRLARQDAERLLHAEAARLAVRYTSVRIGDPQRQWGSCAADGGISLSWRLIMAPPEVFRYVVIHELCHRVHHDHSDAFWALVAQTMPAYDAHRRWLRDHGLPLQAHLARAR